MKAFIKKKKKNHWLFIEHKSDFHMKYLPWEREVRAERERKGERNKRKGGGWKTDRERINKWIDEWVDGKEKNCYYYSEGHFFSISYKCKWFQKNLYRYN